jgi:putative endonuclease
MAEKNETGKKGEAVACSYLEICGYSVLHTNWRHRRYELDIVATNGRELVFVEVKTRSKGCLMDPEESINYYKIKRITETADAYIRKFRVNIPVRFDVLCLIKDNVSYTVEKHYEDAFYPPARVR